MSGGAAELGGPAALRTISSRQTFFVKFVQPIVWIGGFGIGVVAASFAAIVGTLPAPLAWLFLAVWALGTIIFMRLLAPLKKVSIAGNSLVISNYRREITVPLAEIDGVTQNRWLNFHPVTIRLRHDTEFGRTITFMPKARFLLPWSSHPIVSELRDLASEPHQM